MVERAGLEVTNGLTLKSVPLHAYKYKGETRYDNIVCFDIEVSTGFKEDGKIVPFNPFLPSSHYEGIETQSLLYLWNICIDGILFCGRTIQDLYIFFSTLNDMLDGVMVIFIHNIKYEFQFLRNIFSDIDMFARKSRSPIKFRWRNLEFRCSYLLTRLSLDTWGKEKNLPIKKMTGDFEYTVLRTPLTPLTITERDYGYNDVLTMWTGLIEYKERFKHVYNIPLTQTGCIRKEVQKVLKDDYKHKKRVSEMTDISFEAYQLLMAAFLGGYTHANILFANRTIENLWDFDISSSYPWAMISEKYPSTKFIKTSKVEYTLSHRERFCFIVKMKLYGVESRLFNTYISASKCKDIKGSLLDNGRIINAEELTITVCDIDYDIILSSYHIEKIEILEMYYSMKAYLPDEYRRYLITLYKNKTSIKNDASRFTLYYKSKEELNGNYGMAVTKDITDEITFNNDDWDVDYLDETKYNEKRDKKKNKLSTLILSYAQGIYVPAYGRKNLWNLVSQFDDEIIYMDTDSYKTLEDEEILKAIDSYNNSVHEKQKEISKELGISYDDLNPCDYKGEIHSIGCIERDKDIVKFKTLGAKRYLCQYDESLGEDYLKMTVSGVRKKAVKQLSSIDDFEDGLVFSVDNAGKLLLKYIDEQVPWMWKAGESDEWLSKDRYGISGYNIEYHLGVQTDYLKTIAKCLSDYTKVFRRYI